MSQDNNLYGLPNFLVIGAARCGTTTLHEYLKFHPDIFVPKSKRPEPHFFLKNEEYSKGLEYYRSKYFKEHANEKRIGEISTSYLFNANAAKRIFDFNPEIKLVAMLRNPVDRTYSNYWHSVKNGIENESFDFAIQNESVRNEGLSETWKEIAPYAYLGRSKYDQQVTEYLRLFDRDQMHFILFDDFIENTQAELKTLFNFLDVELDVEISIPEIVNNTSTPKNNDMDIDTRSFLSNYFNSSINALEHLIDRDLSKWKS